VSSFQVSISLSKCSSKSTREKDMGERGECEVAGSQPASQKHAKKRIPEGKAVKPQ
jgi:hypothetical protein